MHSRTMTRIPDVVVDHKLSIRDKARATKALRIAMLLLEFPSLNETFILDQITGLIDRGHNVDLYATSPNPEPTVHDEIARYGLLARTVYRDSPKFHMPQDRLRRLWKGTPLLIRSLQKNPRAALNSINVFRLGKSAALL